MTQIPAFATPSSSMRSAPLRSVSNGSRLARVLAQMAVSEVELSNKDFAQKIGQLFDLSDSIKLSTVLGDLSRERVQARETAATKVWEEFLRVRGEAVQALMEPFVVGVGKGYSKFPALKVAELSEAPQSYEAYQRFYAMRQREMDSKVQYLHSYVRDAAQGVSPRLAQLAALDIALGETLIAPTRQFLAAIPKLFERRFDDLFAGRQHYDYQLPLAQQVEANDPEQAGYDWLLRFGREMQALLLAELELRLEPVLGLVEAINEEVEQNHD